MSARPIWASRRDPEVRAALAAGWGRADVMWERMQERAAEAFAAGETRAAARWWRLADGLARALFPNDDPRRATSAANAGLAARLRGQEARAARLYAEARARWEGVPRWIEGLAIAPRARSSLYHLRMESLHRETYHANLRRRLLAFAGETEAALAALAEGRPPGCRLYGRWRAERPAVYDDTRKMLAAALLVGGERPRLRAVT